MYKCTKARSKSRLIAKLKLLHLVCNKYDEKYIQVKNSPTLANKSNSFKFYT